MPASRRIEQAAEQRLRIEVRKTEPLDGTISADERRRRTIADESQVLDRKVAASLLNRPKLRVLFKHPATRARPQPRHCEISETAIPGLQPPSLAVTRRSTGTALPLPYYPGRISGEVLPNTRVPARTARVFASKRRLIFQVIGTPPLVRLCCVGPSLGLHAKLPVNIRMASPSCIRKGSVRFEVQDLEIGAGP